MSLMDDVVFTILYVLVVVATNYVSYRMGYTMGSLDVKISIIDTLTEQLVELVSNMKKNKDGEDETLNEKGDIYE